MTAAIAAVVVILRCCRLVPRRGDRRRRRGGVEQSAVRFGCSPICHGLDGRFQRADAVFVLHDDCLQLPELVLELGSQFRQFFLLKLECNSYNRFLSSRVHRVLTEAPLTTMGAACC